MTNAAEYLLRTIHTFVDDPPDSEFQLGYLQALIAAYREGALDGSAAGPVPGEPDFVTQLSPASRPTAVN
jgi:hypothetical protein